MSYEITLGGGVTKTYPTMLEAMEDLDVFEMDHIDGQHVIDSLVGGGNAVSFGAEQLAALGRELIALSEAK